MKTLYLHIGTTKTGTTAIQSFCTDNEEALRKKGYVYPLFPYQYEHASYRRNARFLVEEDYEGRQGRFRSAMDTILELFRDYPNVILSDEGIWSEPYRKRMDIMKALKEESEEGQFQVKVIVYLRRQDTYLISGWNQGIKSGFAKDATHKWEDYSRDRTTISKLNYGTNLEKLEAVWGRDNIVVRRFEPKRFYGGSIYADFLQAIDLELTDEYQITETERNVRLGGNTHEIQRVINGMDMSRAEHNFFRRALLTFADISAQEYPCEMFSVEEAKEFMERYREENKKVSQMYFGGEELFDLTWKDIPKWEKENPHMQDDLIRFTAACFMQVMEENEKLRRKIKRSLRIPEMDQIESRVKPSLSKIGKKMTGKAKKK